RVHTRSSSERSGRSGDAGRVRRARRPRWSGDASERLPLDVELIGHRPYALRGPRCLLGLESVVGSERTAAESHGAGFDIDADAIRATRAACDRIPDLRRAVGVSDKLGLDRDLVGYRDDDRETLDGLHRPDTLVPVVDGSPEGDTTVPHDDLDLLVWTFDVPPKRCADRRDKLCVVAEESAGDLEGQR